MHEQDGEGDFEVLHEGVPDWLEGSLWRWIMDRAAFGAPAIIERLELRLHQPLTTSSDRPLGQQHPNPQQLIERHWKKSDHDARLTLLDAIVADCQEQGRLALTTRDEDKVEHYVYAAKSLDDLLTNGGSAWTVEQSSERWGLIRRVDEATAGLVTSAVASGTDAARKMKSAWSYCYRRDPNYDLAYREAVLAVEALTIPMTVPKSPRASLGTATAHIRDTLGLWTVGGLDAKEITSGQTLVDMLGTLWHNQERHASTDGGIRDVSRPEGEAAV